MVSVVPGVLFGVEADFLEQLFHHRLQPAGADILDLFVHLGGDLRDARDAVGGEIERHAFGAEQRDILFGQPTPWSR